MLSCLPVSAPGSLSADAAPDGVLPTLDGAWHEVSHRRTWLWLAIAGSACWIAGWVWHYATTCAFIGMGGSRAITCRWESATPGGMTVVSKTAPALSVLWDMAARTIGIPACVIVVGLAVWLVIEQFRRRTG
jgi:hypothetical protein